MASVTIKALPFSTRLTSFRDIVLRDKARAAKFLDKERHKRLHERHHSHHSKHRHRHGHAVSSVLASTGTTTPTSNGDSIDVTDAGVTYTASVGVGSPAQNFTLLIDTGSSNTWVGAGTKYVPTGTSKSTGNTVNVSYGSGSFSGNEYTDTVTLGSGLVIENQSIGVASTAQGFSDVDGILGIGPVDLTQGTVSNTETVPTVTDNLYSQGVISEASIGIFYQPSTSTTDSANGELTFGGVDDTKFTGEINYVPITSTSPASNYWGIDQTVSYGDDTSLLSTTSGIVDTGTTLLLLATEAFDAYQKATGAKSDSTTGLLTITEEQYENLQSVYFNIGGVNYEFTPNAQIWPRALNSALGGDSDKIYLVTSDLGSSLGQGLDFINGYAFLQRFYSVFDTTNSQVGLSTTAYTDATTN